MYHYSHNLGGILNFDATSLSNSKNVWKFDPDQKQWIEAEALQTARGSHAVSLFNVSMLNPELCPVCASGQCLQSPNYPRHYGNNQDKVHATRKIMLGKGSRVANVIMFTFPLKPGPHAHSLCEARPPCSRLAQAVVGWLAS